MKTVPSLLVSIVVATILPGTTHGAVFDLRTSLDETSTTVADRLFLDSGFTVKAPSTVSGAVDTGSVIWIVADTLGDGLPFSLSLTGTLPSSSLLGPDDQIIFATEVDGTIIGNQAGKYQRIGVSANDQFNTLSVPLFAYLWNPTAPGAPGKPDTKNDVLQGMKFGVGPVAVTLDTPDPGNGKWNIYQNINGSQIEVADVVVPEPAGVAWVTGLAALVAGIFRRKLNP